MANQELVLKIAHLRKISNRFFDFKGRETNVPIENIERILQAMGYNLENEAQLQKEAWALDTGQWYQLLEPVTVLSVHRDHWAVSIYVSSAELQSTVQWQISLEGGQTLSGDLPLNEMVQTGDYWMHDGTQYVRRVLPLPEDLPLGYHQLHVTMDERSADSRLIVTPPACFHNPAMHQGDKVWGSAIQLYTLRSNRNWGMGDFTDLLDLMRDMAKQGADYIGLNPIHALFPIHPDHCSPYSPSNRRFLNMLYVDIEAVPEFQESPALKRKVNTKTFHARVTHLREQTMVDYAGVSELKFECFRVLFSVFKKKHLGKGTQRDLAYQRFIEEQGQPLHQHAVFDALLTHFKAQDSSLWGWPVWPEAYRDYQSPEVEAFSQENPDDIQYWMYLQFIADEQLQRAYELSLKLGMKIGLYRDLAVGADRGGAEVWGNSQVFCQQASVGAPPDALGPNGQNWGLPPMDPMCLKQEGYQTFITLLRNNMRACSALRIDHALGLLRLWWCPPDCGAASGAYIYNDLFDLLGILALESQRNECMVIAEDLGTIPAEVTEYFPKVELYSNKVFYFEMGEQGCLPPEHYPAKALAVVCNHDIPTVMAYWTANDLDLRRELSLFESEAEYLNEKSSRQHAKTLILQALGREQLLPADCDIGLPETMPEMTFSLCQAIHEYLARSHAQLVGIQLEDLMLIESPVNIPGTSHEYPNWRRKLMESSQALFAREAVQAFCQRMNQARRS